MVPPPGVATGGLRPASSRNGWQVFSEHDGPRCFQRNTNPIEVEIYDSTTIYNTDFAVSIKRHKWLRANESDRILMLYRRLWSLL